MLPGFTPSILTGSALAGPPVYQISRSLRISHSNGEDAYLVRNIATSPVNFNKLTLSFWLKRASVTDGLQHTVLSASTNSSNVGYVMFDGNHNLYIYEYSAGFVWQTKSAAAFGDIGDWSHFVVSLDTTAVSGQRVRVWVNGLPVVMSGEPAQNSAITFFNRACPHSIGRYYDLVAGWLEGYLAEFYDIDGQSLTANDFGEFSATTGKWVPKKYTGTYGTNGFYLKFADNSNMSALGADSSGNGNTWAVVSLSVTEGIGNDSLVDSPTAYGVDTGLGGELRGNYAVLSPLITGGNPAALTNGNLDAVGVAAIYSVPRATAPFENNLDYFEVTLNGASAYTQGVGFVVGSFPASVSTPAATGFYGISNDNPGSIKKFVNGATGVVIGTTNWASTGDIICVARKRATNELWFGFIRSGVRTWYPPTNGGAAGDPVAGTNATMIGEPGLYPAVLCYSTSSNVSFNAGQRLFAVAAPTGFKVLCTANFPAPVVTQIPYSLRVNRSDSANLYRVFSSSQRKKWTFHCRAKKLHNGLYMALFSNYAPAQNNTDYLSIFWSTDDRLYVNGWSSSYLSCARIFTDTEAWYDIVVALDTNNVAPDNRLRIYVNGVEETNFSVRNNPNIGVDLGINAALTHTLGICEMRNAAWYSGYMTDIHFIDNQQLGPDAFNVFDPVTGGFVPKVYSGAYGTNGFYLDFADATSVATLGYDKSGRNNHWTLEGFSVAAGADKDQMTMSPSNYGVDTGLGGEVRSTFAAMTGVPPSFSQGGHVAIANGGMDVIGTGYYQVVSNFALTSGKWYYEVTVVGGNDTGYPMFGFWKSQPFVSAYYPGAISGTGVSYAPAGKLYYDGTNVAWGSSFTTGDTIGVALDADTGKIWFRKNGTWQVSGDPAAGLNPALTMGGGLFYPGGAAYYGTPTFNFGQRLFQSPAPAGFKCICTLNLPDPVITKPSQYFDVNLRVGTPPLSTINGKQFQPDVVWIKSRNQGYDHSTHDSMRGVSKQVFQNLTNLEGAQTDQLTAFNLDGYTLGANVAGTGSVNQSGANYVDWFWKKGTLPGLDIVTYAGTGVPRTVAHGLGVKPGMIIVKNRTGTAQAWCVYHQISVATSTLLLNSPNAAFTSAGPWNNTQPDASVFTVGNEVAVNGSGYTHVAYLFADVPGFSKLGMYTGNGYPAGPFVSCGFRPKFLLLKRFNGSGNWFIFDAARNPINAAGSALIELYADSYVVEQPSHSRAIDLWSSGFKIRNSDAGQNASGEIYVFAAFAENPFKFSAAR